MMSKAAGEMGTMPFLQLSEAAERCAQETGEQVTSDWLLQFAGQGQLSIFFIARTVMPLESNSATDNSIIYNIGDYINLPSEWASWMHGSIEKPRTVELSLLPTPSGPCFIKDALTGKRITIEVREEDLYVSFEEISSMASTLLERRRKDSEEKKPLHQQLERQAEEKRAAGRYTLREAAKLIAEHTGEREEIILAKLESAAEKYEIATYESGKKAKICYGSGPGKFSVVRNFHDEVFWNDLNKWLIEYEDKITFRFPEPEISRHVHDALPVAEQLLQEDNARAEAETWAAYYETGFNGKAINWRYWVHQMPMLTVAQAARLMSGLEPSRYTQLPSDSAQDGS